MYGTINDKNYEPADAFNKVYMAENMDKELRRGFVRKVFGILGIQLSFTSAITFAFWWFAESMGIISGQPVSPWVIGLAIASLFMIMSVNYIMCCCSGLLRKHPWNYVILGLFTLGQSVLCGIVTAQYTGASVLMVLGLTAGITIGLSMFAVQTKYDITGWGMYLFAACLALMLFSLVMLFVPDSAIPVMHKIYAGLVVLLMGFYIVFDVQLIAGGRKHELSIDDYVLGALMLYIDIVTMFMYILELFGDRR